MRNNIEIFSDSQTLIKTINKKEMHLEIFITLRDIYLLACSFNALKFTFIPRTVNDKADDVAKQALWTLNPF